MGAFLVQPAMRSRVQSFFSVSRTPKLSYNLIGISKKDAEVALVSGHSHVGAFQLWWRCVDFNTCRTYKDFTFF